MSVSDDLFGKTGAPIKRLIQQATDNDLLISTKAIERFTTYATELMTDCAGRAIKKMKAENRKRVTTDDLESVLNDCIVKEDAL